MNKASLKWKAYWESKSSPLHQDDRQEYYLRYSNELKFLYQDSKFNSVLEIGCGDGAMYKELGFSDKLYVGVDLSNSMLEKFRKSNPNQMMKLVLTDAGEIYLDDNKYDLIFQNGVIQYFTDDMVDRFFEYSNKMLNQSGAIIVGSIPWKKCKFSYYMGEYRPFPTPFLRKVYGYISSSFGGPMGRWYTYNYFRKIAKKYSLKCKFFGSLLYPYRFHVVFTKE